MTPDQSKKAQAASAYAEFDKAVKFLRENGYGDWDGTANGQEITLTGCANMMRIYLQAAQAAGRESFIAGELDETHWACGHSKWAAKGDCITCLSHCIDSLNKRLSETTIQLTTLQSQEAAPPPADETQPASSNSPKYMQQGSITTQSLELPAQPSGAQGEGVLTEFEHSEIIRLASYPNNGVTIAEYVETLLAAAREPEAGGK